jgi:hypothetical protein
LPARPQRGTRFKGPQSIPHSDARPGTHEDAIFVRRMRLLTYCRVARAVGVSLHSLCTRGVCENNGKTACGSRLYRLSAILVYPTHDPLFRAGPWFHIIIATALKRLRTAVDRFALKHIAICPAHIRPAPLQLHSLRHIRKCNHRGCFAYPRRQLKK